MTAGGEARREDAELARRFLAALSDGDAARVGELVHPEVTIRTAKKVHDGREAAVEWAGKLYDHLHRRYEPRRIEERPGGVLVHADLEYVWRESGDLGDSSQVEIELGIRDGLISSWYLREE